MISSVSRVLICCLVLVACSQNLEEAQLDRFTGVTMGTGYTVKVVDIPDNLEPKTLESDIVQILDEVNDRMSTYRKDSELSKFNATKVTDWVLASSELVLVVAEALRVSELTGGAFDVTVAPLVNLWGFGANINANRVPSEQEINAGLAKVGYRHLHTKHSPPSLKKDREDLDIDLSAIAKGYAVDRVAGHFESLGIGNYMVEVGGEIRARGLNAKGLPWKIAIERPSPEIRAIYATINLTDHSVATSGDYRNYFEEKGQRFSHTLDPRTGKPIDHSLASVTVISSTAMHADAMATALMVRGLQSGYQLAESERLAAFFIHKTASGFAEKSTTAFKQYIDGEN